MTRYIIEKTRLLKITETFEVEAPSLEYAQILAAELKPMHTDTEIIHEYTVPLIMGEVEEVRG
jgi:hypothetical protein